MYLIDVHLIDVHLMEVYAAVGAYLGGARLGDAYLIFVLTTLEGRLLSAKLQHLANRASAFSQRPFSI